MKIRYIGEENSPLTLFKRKIYECLEESGDYYRLIDETGEDYWYPSDEFEIISV
ncbi:MAG: hypothetical protein IJR47_04895 [Clostridia bacterium]|nr:hypothetical protein [Clostridia bacterium]